MGASNKVLEYLREREGQEVTIEEMVAAGLGTKRTLLTSLSRLVADPRAGVRRVGIPRRQHGVNRPYRYDAPPPPPEVVTITLSKIGCTVEDNALAVDQDGVIYALVPIAHLDDQPRQFLEGTRISCRK